MLTIPFHEVYKLWYAQCKLYQRISNTKYSLTSLNNLALPQANTIPYDLLPNEVRISFVIHMELPQAKEDEKVALILE